MLQLNKDYILSEPEPDAGKAFSLFDSPKSERRVLKVLVMLLAAIVLIWLIFGLVMTSLSSGAQKVSDKFVSLAAKGDTAAAYRLTGSAFQASVSPTAFIAYDKGLADRITSSPKFYSSSYELAHYKSGKHVNYFVINYSASSKRSKTGLLYIKTKIRKYDGQWAVDSISDTDTPPDNNFKL